MASPARVIECPIASVHAIMSVPKPNSCGSWAAATTRTPSLTSSVDGWVLGSVSTDAAEHDDLVSGRRQRRRQLVHVASESADHHRRVLPRHHQDFHERRSLRASSAPNRPSARFQPVGQPLGLLAAARCDRTRDLPGGVRVQMRAIAGVVGRGVLADHERPVARHRQQRLAQDLVGDEIARRRSAHRGVVVQRLVHRRSVRCRRLRCSAATRSATFSPDHTCQSLPEPQELGGNSTALPVNPSAMASDSVPTRTPAAGSARNTRPATPDPRTTSGRTVRCRTPRPRAQAGRCVRSRR